jgi:ATP-binding cassette subfamily C exporter for protease/lipase
MTHRTSILAVADKLLVMRDGGQHAFGPRDEVLAELQKANQPAAAPKAPTQKPASGAMVVQS